MKTGAGPRTWSLRRTLLTGLLLPMALLIAFNTVSLYQQALDAVNTAYDRTLLASAKSIGEQLDVRGYDTDAKLSATVPHAALEAFEADNQSRLYYRVSDPAGHLVSGYKELAFWRGAIPQHTTYAALVDFYDTDYQGQAVRAAVLLQPVASTEGLGMAVIQVAETLELRRKLARQILLDTLWRQVLLLALLALAVVWVVQRATQPVRELSALLQARPENELSPIAVDGAPHELRPLLAATNHVMARLARLLEHQKRFVRDTSHQLRTPLAVLKTQVQSALRGDVGPQAALQEIGETVERATRLANQMLALAKVEQLHQTGETTTLDLAVVLREVALDLAPLITDRHMDFDIHTTAAPVQAHDWMLRELCRNLLHNAIKHTPEGGRLHVDLGINGGQAMLRITDSGPGISAELRERLFQPFAAGDVRQGSGLGLAICQEIVGVLGGSLRLDNQMDGAQVVGLATVVSLSLASKA